MTHDDRQFLQQLFETQTHEIQLLLNAFSISIDKKIDGIATDLKSYRVDPEAHYGGCYRRG